ncbi:transcriptional regulator, LysR family [Delftia sp. Cs1-4]|uniref:LysR family transcriptional regulator n=1 Tax=Delftia sp. (strain Cs1-4) TaxID=742013 RepID=UPI00020E7BCF|nr:LysR family transcriptional regulator [Delftia sp. Cs1-4]AEF88798.1 transcriptional regulator, LysR family [Delftia sp. Cs1-4]
MNPVPPTPIEANDLLLFARIAETGSFTRAAEQLLQPRSTVSRRLADLERILGERLVVRSTRKLRLTEFGQAMLVHASQIADGVEAASAFAAHRQAAPSGRLHVALPSHFAQTFAAGMIDRFLADYPAITLDLDLTTRRIDLLTEDYDLVIRIGPLEEDASLTVSRLADLPVGLYAAPQYLERAGTPGSPQALLDRQGLIVSRQGRPVLWELSRPGEGGAHEHWTGLPPPRCLVTAGEFLVGLALAGHGIAGLTDALARPYLESGRLRRVLPQWHLPPMPAWAIFPSRKLMPAKTRVFIDALRAFFHR